MKTHVRAFFETILLCLFLLLVGAFGAFVGDWMAELRHKNLRAGSPAKAPPEWTFDTTGGEMYKMLPPLDSVPPEPRHEALVFSDSVTIRGWFCMDSVWTPTDTNLPRDTTVSTPSGPFRVRSYTRCL